MRGAGSGLLALTRFISVLNMGKMIVSQVMVGQNVTTASASACRCCCIGAVTSRPRLCWHPDAFDVSFSRNFSVRTP